MHQRLHLDETTLARFCEQHHIRRLTLFGSHLKGTARPDSDIDLLIDLESDHVPGLLALASAVTTSRFPSSWTTSGAIATYHGFRM
ncbi:MAG TPA: nucleotidyltransferase domain-containing protein [Candidatus Tectomicrobia bacterium]